MIRIEGGKRRKGKETTTAPIDRVEANASDLDLNLCLNFGGGSRISKGKYDYDDDNDNTNSSVIEFNGLFHFQFYYALA